MGMSGSLSATAPSLVPSRLTPPPSRTPSPFNSQNTTEAPVPGQIMYFPPTHMIPADSVISDALEEQWYGNDVSGHASLIYKIDGEFALCLGITSFSEREGFTAKYKSASWGNRFVPIDHNVHPEHAPLSLATGRFQKESYVNIEGAYAIEWRHLKQEFYGQCLSLTEQSLTTLRHLVQSYRQPYSTAFKGIRPNPCLPGVLLANNPRHWTAVAALCKKTTVASLPPQVAGQKRSDCWTQDKPQSKRQQLITLALIKQTRSWSDVVAAPNHADWSQQRPRHMHSVSDSAINSMRSNKVDSTRVNRVDNIRNKSWR